MAARGNSLEQSQGALQFCLALWSDKVGRNRLARLSAQDGASLGDINRRSRMSEKEQPS